MDLVTSLAEVWIETVQIPHVSNASLVTSLAEVWIETVEVVADIVRHMSLPLRKCGLKQ